MHSDGIQPAGTSPIGRDCSRGIPTVIRGWRPAPRPRRGRDDRTAWAERCDPMTEPTIRRRPRIVARLPRAGEEIRALLGRAGRGRTRGVVMLYAGDRGQGRSGSANLADLKSRCLRT